MELKFPLNCSIVIGECKYPIFWSAVYVTLREISAWQYEGPMIDQFVKTNWLPGFRTPIYELIYSSFRWVQSRSIKIVWCRYVWNLLSIDYRYDVLYLSEGDKQVLWRCGLFEIHYTINTEKQTASPFIGLTETTYIKSYLTLYIGSRSFSYFLLFTNVLSNLIYSNLQWTNCLRLTVLRFHSSQQEWRS